jgi:hypothetical protein
MANRKFEISGKWARRSLWITSLLLGRLAWAAPLGDELLHCLQGVAGVPSDTAIIGGTLPGQTSGALAWVVQATRNSRYGFYVFPGGMSRDTAYFVTLPPKSQAVGEGDRIRPAYFGFQLGPEIASSRDSRLTNEAGNLFTVRYPESVLGRGETYAGLVDIRDLPVFQLDTIDRGKVVPWLLETLDSKARGEAAKAIGDGLLRYSPLLSGNQADDYADTVLRRAKIELPAQRLALEACRKLVIGTEGRQLIERVSAQIYRQELVLKQAEL